MAQISLLSFNPTIGIDPSNLLIGDRKGDQRVIDFCKVFTCHHQGLLIQYLTFTNEYHKNLRLEMDSDKPQKAENVKKIRRAFNRFINEGFKDAWMSSVYMLNTYYNNGSDNIPRFCLKGTEESETDDREKYIVDIFRENGKATNSKCLIDDNTGFAECSKNGYFYMLNDIPSSAKKGNYKNPRLDKRLVDDYRLPSKLEFSRRKGFDKKWGKCWDGYKEGVPSFNKTCYRSTLIIPLTLIGNQLSDVFKSYTHIGKNAERMIYGFFCMDHVSLNAFSNEDVAIGYIVADWLSIYLIMRYNFVVWSEVYNKSLSDYPN